MKLGCTDSAPMSGQLVGTMATDDTRNKASNWPTTFGEEWTPGIEWSEEFMDIQRGLASLRTSLDDEEIESLGIQIKTAYGEQVYAAPWLRHLPFIIYFAEEELEKQRRTNVLLLETVQELRLKVESLETDNAVLARVLKQASR